VSSNISRTTTEVTM